MRCPLLVSLLFAALLNLPAWAADKPRLQPLPEIPPPPGMTDGLEPQITIRPGGKDRVEEYRVKGRLYMLKVTPPHGKPYYLVDMKGDGLMRHFDDLSPDFKVPLWVIGEF